jgi:hypothetical protein
MLAFGLAMMTVPASAASAQIVRGTVIDSLTKTPIKGVTVALRSISPDSSIGGAVTDSLGEFSIRAPEPGIYLIAARVIGFVPLAGRPEQLDSAGVRVVRFEMWRNVTQLDSIVRVAEHSAFGISSGATWYAKHVVEGKGMFFAGLDIIWSKLKACDYLAKLPGLMYTPATSDPSLRGIRCEPTNEVITSTDGGACLEGQIDHNKIAYMDSANVYEVVGHRGTAKADTLGDTIMVKIENVRGVEVYRNRDERPKDMSIPNDIIDLPSTSINTPPTAVRPSASRGCVWIQIWTAQGW